MRIDGHEAKAELPGLRVYHVVATGQRRGAEIFAADLIERLAAMGATQRLGIVRDDYPVSLSFRAPVQQLGARRRSLPGLRIDPRAAMRLRRELRTFRPTLVQAHGGEAYKYALAATLGTGVPVVYRRITEVPVAARKGLTRAAHGWLMRRADRIVAVADYVRQETTDLFQVPDELVVTIPGGADPARFRSRAGGRIRRELGIADDAHVFLSLIALKWEKNPSAHLEVAARVAARDDRARYLIAGDGPLRSEVEEEVRARGLAGRVFVLGNRSDVPDLLAASDAVLLASSLEGMPGCLIEAGMARLPSVAYDLAGISEVVVHGETGFLVPPGDVEGLAAALAELFEDEALRSRLGAAASTRCVGLFDLGAVVEGYANVYRSLERSGGIGS
ncbi:MAG TPA: glycosyltransferase family 4 protein [Actinomycetota bacterium]